jgi:Family of unknown function (DUF6370)
MVTLRITTRMALIGAVICALVLPAAAAEETLESTLVCAKCFLKKPDAMDCQDVLIVAAANGDRTEYYIGKNDVAEKAGESCTTQVKARVTGTVSQEDGKTWLTPSKIDKRIEKR